jgi:hypothetical protein
MISSMERNRRGSLHRVSDPAFNQDLIIVLSEKGGLALVRAFSILKFQLPEKISNKFLSNRSLRVTGR